MNSSFDLQYLITDVCPPCVFKAISLGVELTDSLIAELYRLNTYNIVYLKEGPKQQTKNK